MTNVVAPKPDEMSPQVLLVDDEEYALEEYRELLELEDIGAVIETAPFAAIETAIEHPEIKVLVTDLRMPALNGSELIQRLLARLPKGRRMRFIVLSGYLEGVAETPGLSSVRLLEKPVDAADLAEAVRQALRD